MKPLPPIRSLDDVFMALHALDGAARLEADGPWSPSQILEHCAQSIEYSLDGFPVLKPRLVRATIGRLVLRRFLGRGSMSHNRVAPIPGAPPPRAGGDWRSATERLRKAIERFNAHHGACAEHFVYGPVTGEQYARLHAMHLADHFGALRTG
jgi:hypothetical protein